MHAEVGRLCRNNFEVQVSYTMLEEECCGIPGHRGGGRNSSFGTWRDLLVQALKAKHYIFGFSADTKEHCQWSELPSYITVHTFFQ